jgi:hypothetical protein
MPLSYPVWSDWFDSPEHTWPTELQNFWSKVDSAAICYTESQEQAVVHGLRAHYANDEELSAIADWIECWSVKDVKLTYMCCPFSPPMQPISIVKKVPFKYVLNLHK